jgi:hypothetical protein
VEENGHPLDNCARAEQDLKQEKFQKQIIGSRSKLTSGHSYVATFVEFTK